MSNASPSTSRRAPRRWRPLLGILISAIFIAWAVNGLELDAFGQHLRDAQYIWLLPGIAAYFGAVWARTWRWHYMLRHLADVPMGQLFRIVCIGYMGNNIYPLRAGEILRSYVLKREHGVRMSPSLATVAIERLFDGLTMLAFVFVALPLVKFETAALVRFQPFVVGFTILFLLALMAFLVVAPRPDFVQRLAFPVADRLALAWTAVGASAANPESEADPIALRDRLLAGLDRFMRGLGSLASGRDVGLIFATSVVVWLMETVKYWFVMHAFDFSVSFFVLMLMNGVVNLATTLPAGPGHVGTFDAPGIAVLVAAGVERARATAYTGVLHVALWLPITVLGGWYLWRSHLSVRQAREALAEDVEDARTAHASTEPNP